MNKRITKKRQNMRLKNPKPSKQLLKALKGAEDIASGKIKVPSYNNIDDLRKALLEDLEL